MSTQDLIQDCLEQLRASASVGAVRRIADDRGFALLASPGAAFELVAAIVDSVEPDRAPFLKLFEILIRDARLDEEDRGRLGGKFLDEAGTTIELMLANRGLDPDASHGLMLAYARAEADAPESLILAMIGQFGALQQSGRIPLDPDAEVDRLRQRTGSSDFVRHLSLDDRIAVLPVDAQAAFVNDVASRNDEFCGRLGLYWLLDGAGEIRLGAASGLYDRATRGIVEPVAAGLLPVLRNWIPPDEARPVVDAVLREARRRDLVAPLEHSLARPERLLATLPASNGVQTFTAALEGDGRADVAIVQLKAGLGILEAFVAGGAPARKAMQNQEASHPVAVPVDALHPLLASAMAEGLADERPPPPGLIDVALACRLGELRPRPMTAADWLAHLDPEGEIAALPADQLEDLIVHSATWPKNHPETKYWAEGTALYEGALESVADVEQLAPAFWSLVEERRGDWAMLMLRTAHVLKAGASDDWRSFAATGSALIDGHELRTIPIMGYVFDMTRAASFAEQPPG